MSIAMCSSSREARPDGQSGALCRDGPRSVATGERAGALLSSHATHAAPRAQCSARSGPRVRDSYVIGCVTGGLQARSFSGWKRGAGRVPAYCAAGMPKGNAERGPRPPKPSSFETFALIDMPASM